jgi:hypothetical protein
VESQEPKQAESTTPLLDVLVEFMEQDNWPINKIEGQNAVSVNFQGTSGRWGCIGRTDEDKQLALFFSYAPIKVGEDKRDEMAKFLTKANYGLYIGNFEFDYNDGEVRCKTSLDVEGSALDTELVKRMVYNNVGIMDKYLPGIMGIVYGNMDAADAIKKTEG